MANIFSCQQAVQNFVPVWCPYGIFTYLFEQVQESPPVCRFQSLPGP